MKFGHNQQAFLELVRAGLWEEEARLSQFGDIDYAAILQLAEEQSLVGLVTAGLDYVSDVKVPQEWMLQFIGETLQIEQQNKDMNAFVAKLISKLREKDVYAILVKGQGVAQCYEKPLWRASGDVDLYLSKDNYEKAKAFLVPLAQDVEKEGKKRLHLGMTIDGWVVELHGTMHTKLSRRMNRVSDEVHRDIFFHGKIRSWNINGVQVFLPNANNDVVIIFNHFINHFFMEGVGLRQICDWCRLLWCYREEIDLKLLESRIRKAGLMSEWMVFAALVVNTLGMPIAAMPFYGKGYENKAEKVLLHVMANGNFGHNRDVSYRTKKQAAVVNVITLWRRFHDFSKFSLIFPIDSPRFFVKYVFGRLKNGN